MQSTAVAAKLSAGQIVPGGTALGLGAEQADMDLGATRP